MDSVPFAWGGKSENVIETAKTTDLASRDTKFVISVRPGFWIYVENLNLNLVTLTQTEDSPTHRISFPRIMNVQLIIDFNSTILYF